MKGVNAASPEAQLPDERLERSFNTWWPQVSSALEDILAIDTASTSVETLRSTASILDEVLELTRSIKRTTDAQLNLSKNSKSRVPYDSRESRTMWYNAIDTYEQIYGRLRLLENHVKEEGQEQYADIMKLASDVRMAFDYLTH